MDWMPPSFTLHYLSLVALPGPVRDLRHVAMVERDRNVGRELVLKCNRRRGKWRWRPPQPPRPLRRAGTPPAPPPTGWTTPHSSKRTRPGMGVSQVRNYAKTSLKEAKLYCKLSYNILLIYLITIRIEGMYVQVNFDCLLRRGRPFVLLIPYSDRLSRVATLILISILFLNCVWEK